MRRVACARTDEVIAARAAAMCRTHRAGARPGDCWREESVFGPRLLPPRGLGLLPHRRRGVVNMCSSFFLRKKRRAGGTPLPAKWRIGTARTTIGTSRTHGFKRRERGRTVWEWSIVFTATIRWPRHTTRTSERGGASSLEWPGPQKVCAAASHVPFLCGVCVQRFV